MKKLSLLIALCMLLTIGGVYATWSYVGSTDIIDAFAESKVTIADAVIEGTYGIYKIDSNLVLTVDQANDNHEAELVFGSNNDQPVYLTVTFTPSVNAPKAIKDNAIASELYFGVTTLMQYKMDADGNYSESGTPVDIFKFKNSGNGTLDNTFAWTKNDDGTFTYTLNADALKEQISLSQTFVLDIKAEHDAFRSALVGNIVARVTDGTVN
ncbi:MAG: hypothetical protein E7365_04095 [Clostridiales bacterium]|nr:hypothetical protein [Clostridiales bacterium]